MESDYIPSGEESQAREQLRLILPDLLHSASQRSIQRALDSLSFTSLKASLCLRDQARLNTIASPHAGAWLRALPNPLLGLAMPQQEFCVAIRLWLGIKLFPPPPQSLRCSYGQVIDPQGDHTLGCGLGLLRIKRHDSLQNIIWQALLVDNPRAAREQHCSVDNNRPGDIFHPDFVQEKPAYFDVSVRNSLQLQFLCRAASLAGAAGEAGEMAKDARHEEGVIAAGGVFFPLVVETLGLWTLWLIATRASALSGITRGQAFSNLIQQLSVKLWCYNSKLVIARLVNSGAFPAQWDL